MTHKEKINSLDAILQPIIENGFDGISEVFSSLLTTAMKIERERYLNAGAYERTEDRRGFANGFKSRSLKTRVGKLDVDVPQVRGVAPFQPRCQTRLKSWTSNLRNGGPDHLVASKP